MVCGRYAVQPNYILFNFVICQHHDLRLGQWELYKSKVRSTMDMKSEDNHWNDYPCLINRAKISKALFKNVLILLPKEHYSPEFF